jgi:hypothetical protein
VAALPAESMCRARSARTHWPAEARSRLLAGFRRRGNRLSRLNSMAFGLAVYVSRCWLPFTAQDSLPAAGQALLGGLLPARLR